MIKKVDPQITQISQIECYNRSALVMTPEPLFKMA